MRLIAAVVNYNSGKNLTHLLPQLIDQDFDAIFVLDDASTDNSLELIYEFSDSVEAIEGSKNLGPAGNRNRIISRITPGDVVMFIDADMLLRTRNVRSQILSIFSDHPTAGLIGGGIINKRGKPMAFNYGHNQPLYKDVIGVALSYLANVLHLKPLIWPIRSLSRLFTLNVEIAHFTPQQRVVDWVAEGHCYIRGTALKKLGGFDEALQYGEGKDLADRMRAVGLKALFDPNVWTQHLEFKTRSVSKLREHNKVREKLESNKKSRSLQSSSSSKRR